MVMKALLLRPYKGLKSLLRGSSAKVFIEFEFVDGREPLKVELVGMKSNRGRRLNWVRLKLSPDVLKVTISPLVARRVADMEIIPGGAGKSSYRVFSPKLFDQGFVVDCQDGSEVFEAKAILRKEGKGQLSKCAA